MADHFDFEFGFTDENGDLMRFGVYGVAEDVARGIRKGLRSVSTITQVVAAKVVTSHEVVAPGDPTA
jgi:hypothetical protein